MPLFSRRKKHQPPSSFTTLQSSPAQLSTLSLHHNPPSSYTSPPEPVVYRRFSETPTAPLASTSTINPQDNPPDPRSTQDSYQSYSPQPVRRTLTADPVVRGLAPVFLFPPLPS